MPKSSNRRKNGTVVKYNPNKETYEKGLMFIYAFLNRIVK
jgi:DNA gyrase/topoisomerase IV subunit B